MLESLCWKALYNSLLCSAEFVSVFLQVGTDTLH